MGLLDELLKAQKPKRNLMDTQMVKGPDQPYLRQDYPTVYGALGGLLGTAPDVMEGSVMDPNTAAVRQGAEYGFPIGTALGVLPMARFTKGLPVGMGIKPINLEKGIYRPELTMEEMLKVKDIPTVERVRKSMELVGEKEFENMVNAQFKKYKPTDQDQEAMLVESVTLNILGKAQRTPYPQQAALDLAQQRAALPVEQGGLGLPAGNTAEQRAAAMGFDVDAYHGTTADIRMFSPEFRGEATGAQSAKKAYFLAADPLNPPAQMLTKAPANSESVKMLRNLGISDEEIAKLNQVSMKGHGAETASGYANIGGSRDYKEAMRKANAAEKAGNWGDYEKWMQIAEDAEIGRNQYSQGLVAKYGDARDTMLAKINDSILSKKLSQEQAAALDAKMKQLMPYGWYNSYSIPQLKALKTKIAKLSDAPEGVAKSIDDFISVKAERQLAENTQQGSNVMPLMVRSQNPMNYDFGGSAYRDQSYADLIDKAANAKSDVLFLRNTFDPGAGPAKLVDVLAVLDPSRIRSRFAAFDPFRLTPAIAATMGVAAPDLMANPVDEEELRRLQSGLLYAP